MQDAVAQGFSPEQMDIVLSCRVGIARQDVYKKEKPMSNPTIASKAPLVVELEPGTYHWCSCGQSKKQPYCDGGHKGTEFKPVKFTIEEKKKVALCQCKHTKNAPFCDGGHKKL